MLSRIEDFQNLGIQTRVFIDSKDSNLKIQFNKDFFIHIEVYRTIDDFLKSITADKKSDGDFLVNKTAIWLNQFLSKAFSNGLASTEYKPEYIKISRSY